MDEGNIATNAEYRRYVERFNDVFHVSHTVKVGATAYLKTLVLNRSICDTLCMQLLMIHFCWAVMLSHSEVLKELVTSP